MQTAFVNHWVTNRFLAYRTRQVAHHTFYKLNTQQIGQCDGSSFFLINAVVNHGLNFSSIMVAELKLFKLCRFVFGDCHARHIQHSYARVQRLLEHKQSRRRLQVVRVVRIVGRVIRVVKFLAAAFPAIAADSFCRAIFDARVVERPFTAFIEITGSAFFTFRFFLFIFGFVFFLFLLFV